MMGFRVAVYSMSCDWKLVEGSLVPRIGPGPGNEATTMTGGNRLASFPGSHAPEHKHLSCAGVESLVSFLT